MRRRGVRLAAGVLTTAALLAGVPATPAASAAAGAGLGSYTAVAGADLVRVTFAVAPPVVFDPLLDPGASQAQVVTDSLGQSRGYAATQNPGTLFDALGGTAGTVTGGAVGEEQIPKNPLAVRSEHPLRPNEAKRAGAIDLSTRSRATTSTARASDGSSTADAAVDVDLERSSLQASASAVVQQLDVNPLLKVNGVRSSAVMTRTSTGEVTRSSTFEVASIVIMGMSVSLDREELSLLGTTVATGPLAQSTAAPLLAALAERGVNIAFFPAVETPSSVRSAALTVTATLDLPPAAGGLQKAVATYTVGGTVAAITAAAVPAAAVDADVVDPPTTSTVPGQPATTPDDAATADPVVSPDLASIVAPAQAGVPDRLAAVGVPSAGALQARRLPLNDDLATFYVVLALGAACVVGIARLHRHMTGDLR
jgi:hypothetical protein